LDFKDLVYNETNILSVNWLQTHLVNLIIAYVHEKTNTLDCLSNILKLQQCKETLQSKFLIEEKRELKQVWNHSCIGKNK
jgi:hypothetical protein